MPKNINEEIKTSAVTSLGLHSYSEARFTLAMANGMRSSMNIIPFIIGSKSSKRKTKKAKNGKMINFTLSTHTTKFLLIVFICVP